MSKIAVKKFAVLATVAVLLTAMATSSSVLARTIPANLGTARLGNQAATFSYSFSTGAVSASGSADFALGLPSDACGNKTVFVTARATAVGGLVRAVTSNNLGTVVASTSFSSIPVSATFVEINLGTVVLPCGGVLFLDALMNNGSSILRADYNA